MIGILSELGKWDGFYSIVGSAAGALIGLQFVVMTLVAERPPVRAAEAGAAFATPTIIHFSAVLLLSALIRAPWQTMWVITTLWAVIGFSGVAYVLIVARRMRKQGAYRPEFEDWLFHMALPLAAYAILALSPFTVSSFPREALFGIGGAALLLLFVGIHNSWDGIAYHVFVNRTNVKEPPDRHRKNK